MKSSLSPFQPLTAQTIRSFLSTRCFGRTLHLLDEVSSTNSLAAELAQKDTIHGTVIVADAQSSGRGRLGRGWHSPPGKNLYCSVILRLGSPTDPWPHWLSWIPLISSVAVSRSIQTITGLRATIKWPNDILVRSRKIGGVLCESNGAGASTVCVVVGIGLNVNERSEHFPAELQESATSVFIEAGHPFDRAIILATFLSELEIRYDAMISGKLSDLMDEYRLRCATIGQRVRVSLTDGAIEGFAESVEADGSLRMIRSMSSNDSRGGSTVNIRAGDVMHLRSSEM